MTQTEEQNRRGIVISDIMFANPDVFELKSLKSGLPDLRYPTPTVVIAILPLKRHKIYGKTVLAIQETLSSHGSVENYRYAWELAKTQLTKNSVRLITSFDKQPHPKPPHNVKTDPFHHHYDGNNSKLRDNTGVQELRDVIDILRDYIKTNSPYLTTHRF